MGSWNKTCNLSSLPILEGTSIYCFPVFKGSYKNRCYTTSDYNPLPFALEGVNADMCYADINESIAKREFLKTVIKDCYVSPDSGDHTLGDVKGYQLITLETILHRKREKHNDSLYDLQELSNDGVLFYHNGNTVPLEFSYIRKDIVDDLTRSFPFSVYDSKTQSYVEFTFEEILQSIDVDAMVLIEYIKQIKSPYPFFSLSNASDFLWERRFINKSFYFITNANKFSFSKFIIEDIFFENKDSEFAFKEAYLAFIKAAFIDDIMGKLRKKWTYNSFCGNQDQNFEDHNILSIAIRNSIAKTLDEFAKDYD